MVNTIKVLEKELADVGTIALEARVEKEKAERVICEMLKRAENHKRQKAPLCPDGGISLSAAERKYNVPNPTIYRWKQRGLFTVLLKTAREVYVNESELAKVVKQYLEDPGRGKKTLRRGFNHG